MQRVRSKFVILATHGFALALLAGGCSPSRRAGESERVVVENTAREERVVIDGVNYRLALDELGVVVETHAEGEAALLDVVGSRRALRFTGQHWVLDVGESTRQDLVQLALEAERLVPGFVRAAGPVLRREGGNTPFILGGQLAVTFEPGVDDERARAIVVAHGGRLSYRRLRDPSSYAVRVDPEAPGAAGLDALRLAEVLRALDEVRRAEAALIVPVEDHGSFAGDPYLDRQWHHHNGIAGGTADADVDTFEAWGITAGDPNIVVAIVDHGFEVDHEDLSGNLWTNPGETPNGIDDGDPNEIVDDLHGANFESDPPSGVFPVSEHGLSVAGLAGAERGNPHGGAGTCPDCPLMFVERGTSAQDHAEAIDYAVKMGARVVNLSWGYLGDEPLWPEVSDALDAAAAAGVVCVAAMSNAWNKDDCQSADPSIPSHGAVIGVSGSDHHDRRIPTSVGLCADVLAPSKWIDLATGETVGIGTTDLTGAAGYNSTISQGGNCPDVSDLEFTVCFGGNSAASPIVAGIAGLALSADPTLTPDAVENLLRDTADRVEHSKAQYRLSDGRSEVDVNGATTSTHGSGRVNAFEAVRVVAPVASGGRGGVDVFLRDHVLDWGNTERPSYHRFEKGGAFIGYWKSVDIKVDAPPYDLPLQPTPAQFDDFPREDPKSVVTNRVFVRVRNRGPNQATGVRVRLFRAFAGAGLPVLPSDFAGPGTPSASSWTYLGEQVVGTLAYSGPSAAGVPAEVVSFDFVGPLVGTGQAGSKHHCLLALVESDVDHVSYPSLIPDELTPNDNNVAQLNLQVLPLTVNLTELSTQFLLHNPHPRPRTFRARVLTPGVVVTLDLSGLGLGSAVRGSLSPSFELGPGAEVLVGARTTWRAGVRGDVDFVQERLTVYGSREIWEPLGGWTIHRRR